MQKVDKSKKLSLNKNETKRFEEIFNDTLDFYR